MTALIKNGEAQAGVGTLIIFIAMVLVAAVAAAVLLQTQGQMNAKSSQTVKSAATAIGENLIIVAIDGSVSNNALTGLNVTVQGAPGSSTIDLSKVILKAQGQVYNFSNSTSGGSATSFGIWPIRLANGSTLGSLGSYSTGTPGLDTGSIARLDLSVASLNLQPNTYVTLALTPQSGATINNPVTLPAFSGTSVSIYP